MLTRPNPIATSDGWPEPEPLGSDLPEVPAFDPDLLPVSFRPLVEDIADRMQVPLDFPSVAAIATLAGMTNRRAIIQPKRNDTSWLVTPNLWGGIVAPPGMMKSPVIACMTKPAREIEAEWRSENKADMDAFEAEQERAKAGLFRLAGTLQASCEGRQHPTGQTGMQPANADRKTAAHQRCNL